MRQKIINIGFMFVVFMALIFASFTDIGSASTSVEKQTVSLLSPIGARVAIAPVQIIENSAIVILKNNQEYNLAKDLIPAAVKTIRADINQKNVFSDVVVLDQAELPLTFRPVDIIQAGREAGADLVLYSTISEFQNKTKYGFSQKLIGSLTLELILFETASGARIWHKRVAVEQQIKVRVSGQTNDQLKVSYLQLAADVIVGQAMSELSANLHRDLADYKPPALAETIVASQNFVTDVDRIPDVKVAPDFNKYAIVIGIEEYRDLPKAEYTVRDAKIMKEYLVKLMGYPEENIVTLLNNRATKGDIEGYLNTWLKNNVDSSSKVMVYYAGHGAPNPATGKAFLIPYDGDPAFPETSGIPLDDIYASLCRLDTRETVLIMDACFSGAGGRSVMAKGGRPVAISVENPVLQKNNFMVMSAAKGTQVSNSYPEKRHGLFTYFLLKGLQGAADINGNQIVSMNELYRYVTPKVMKEARVNNKSQTPQLTPDPESSILLTDIDLSHVN
ncbi:MAG: caspase family protein [Proteobacteria bacterium]|nr:caspase family protein [Pseudomonadota bacterium]MBU1714877.1 caspase family protein [Pseudomonadota bacterium]